METVFVCGVCGKKTTDLDGWVFGQKYCAPAGEMIIRCPEHIIDEDGETKATPKDLVDDAVVMINSKKKAVKSISFV